MDPSRRSLLRRPSDSLRNRLEVLAMLRHPAVLGFPFVVMALASCGSNGHGSPYSGGPGLDGAAGDAAFAGGGDDATTGSDDGSSGSSSGGGSDGSVVGPG